MRTGLRAPHRSLLLSLSALAVCGLQAQPLPPPPTRAAPAQTTLFLELVVNERASGQVVPVVVRAGQYWVEAGVLQNLHVRAGAPSGLVAVNQIPGVGVQYDSTGQRLLLTVPTDWLPTQTLDAGLPGNPFAANSSPGALLNYDVYASNPHRSDSNVSVWLEQRVFGPWGSLSNTGVHRPWARGNEKTHLRYDTQWTYADTDRVRTYTVGDHIAAPLSWGSAVRLGGLRVARNFAIRPDLITYPLPRFSGQAAVPSAVDLFINGHKAGAETVQPGPFTLNTVPYVTGAGEAALVTTDALGRQVVTTLPFYVANTLLKPGMTDYSLSAGKLRRGYGVENFDYGPTVLSSGGRIGVSDSFTLEGRAEVARSLAVVGVGGVQALGTLGVVNASLSRSQLRGQSGHQLTLGYQYNERRFSLGAQHTRRSRGYGDLSTFDVGAAPLSRSTSQVSASLSLGLAGAVAMGYFDIEAADTQRTRLLSLNYSKPLGQRTYLSVNLNKPLGQGTYSLQALLTFVLGERGMLGLSASQDRGSRTRAQATYSQNPASEGGLGWNLAYAQNGAGSDYRQAGLTWRTQKAQLQGGVFSQGRGHSSWLGAAGSVVYMDGGWFAANRVNDAFILVSTDGVPDVPVRYENQLVGRTNAAGHILVPNVPGYYPARVEVDALELPDHLQVPDPVQRLAVRSGTGALLRVEVDRQVAARITLVDDSGLPLPVGWSVQHVQSGNTTVVGWDGQVYVDQLKPRNDLVVRGPGNTRCSVGFDLPTTAPSVLRIGPLVCRPQAGSPLAQGPALPHNSWLALASARHDPH